ncbi:pyruvate dehydrogenase complex dihydrolipoamide acetyltransferase [Pseudohoeflea coraliihabitans]|uniref:Acetyltransferase component of pyruvate dehydrogenase complex n=1 Tax=Pseudohoeflea coraliihabitans TaxID=2860393 RepID=A0ABS6WL74_9HYPH|nr:pyruvate dehydrogenase complex dihydrolipoamide acetyltransferase [Pseudohoeflea sp. DP4N28-3]MBW3096692.1 pyruvate dehydrogenase complex dihydrolipoamide acetyltransferase [Pseudohoeflea sp. DP4N28-3]
MPVEVILPKVDMDMATGQISSWSVAEGDAVKKGDVLFEIETDKAAMEIEAPESGTLRHVTGKAGVDIPVGEVVAWIYREGEAVDSAPEPAAAAADTQQDKADAADAKLQPQPASSPTTAAPSKAAAESGAVRATPLARRKARELGIDLAEVAGSGPRGRIVKADLDAFSAENTAAATAVAAPGTVTEGAEDPGTASSDAAKVLDLFQEGTYELRRHDSMRRTIARRLTEAKSTVPHFYLTLDCAIDALLALRKELNAAAPLLSDHSTPAYKLSVNDFIIKAHAMALADIAEANVSWTQDAMVLHQQVDVGVAVSIPGGLITPIVRRAEQKSLSAISNEVKDLAGRARERKLKTLEFQGGTTAVSNLGMFGIQNFSAVVNPPHATILAVGAGQERAVAKNGKICAATMMSVTLSTDHRAVDGALAAELLASFQRLIENPLRLLV